MSCASVHDKCTVRLQIDSNQGYLRVIVYGTLACHAAYDWTMWVSGIWLAKYRVEVLVCVMANYCKLCDVFDVNNNKTYFVQENNVSRVQHTI